MKSTHLFLKKLKTLVLEKESTTIVFFKKNKITCVSVFAAFLFVYLLLPRAMYQGGNIFFGGSTSLYNVNLAQYFFIYSAHPLFGRGAPYAHYQLSRTYFITGDLDNALTEAYLELEEYPDHAHTYYILGLTLGYMGREQEAIDAFTKFIEYDPYTWAGRNDKAWLQFRVGDIEGALETIKPVSGMFQNAWIQNTYGTILLNMERYDEAEQAFEHAAKVVSGMDETRWGGAYPGNDPRIYNVGLSAMKHSIESNLTLIKEKKERELLNSIHNP